MLFSFNNVAKVQDVIEINRRWSGVPFEHISHNFTIQIYFFQINFSE